MTGESWLMRCSQMKRKGKVTNIILIYMLICAHTNTNIILLCTNKNNMKCWKSRPLWRFWQIQFHKFVQYWFTSVWEIPVMASFSWFSFLSARQPLPTFLSPWLVMLDLKIIFFWHESDIRVKLKIWADVVAPSSNSHQKTKIYKNPK